MSYDQQAPAYVCVCCRVAVVTLKEKGKEQKCGCVSVWICVFTDCLLLFTYVRVLNLSVLK